MTHPVQSLADSHDVAMQGEITSLKARFGHAVPQPRRLGAKANDMSHAGLQILQLELDNLHAERAQRERKLDMLLGRLRKACIELDEDDSAAAAAAHPSLQHHRSVSLTLAIATDSHHNSNNTVHMPLLHNVLRIEQHPFAIDKQGSLCQSH